MSDMIDMVAKAIDHSLVNRSEYPGEPSHSDILDAARAAIEAMREPTEEMIEALAPYCSQGPLDPGCDSATRAWKRAIATALEDPA